MLLGKLLPEPLEVEHVDVEVVDQSAGNLKYRSGFVMKLSGSGQTSRSFKAI